MDLSTIANVATAAAVITGVVFGVVEVRAARREREERAAFEVLHAILTTEWMRSVVQVQAIPADLPGEQLEANPSRLEAAQAVGITLEVLGYAVFSRLVPLRVIDELVGGTVRVAWSRMRPYVEFERARSGSQKSWEWFQWLAERLADTRSATSLARGAQEAHRDWRP